MEDNKDTVSPADSEAEPQQIVISEPVLEVPLVPAASSVVEAAFKEDDKVRAVLKKHLRGRARDSQKIALLAREAFENFKPSLFTPTQRAERNFVAPGDSLVKPTRSVIEKGVAAMSASAGNRSLKIHLTEDLKRLVRDDSSSDGSARNIQLDDLVNHLNKKIPDVQTLRNTTRNACEAKVKAKQILDRFNSNVNPNGSSTVPVQPVVATVASSASSNGDESPDTNDFVSKQVRDLMAGVTPPEKQVLFETDEKRAELSDTEKNVSSFQLRKGASDVISYHDFKVLQIAFEHIWTELFDTRLTSFGTQLYHEAVKLETFLQPSGTTNINFSISSIPDLLALMRSIRELSQTGTQETPEFVEVEDNGQVRRVATIPGAARLSRLMDEIELILKQRYSFAVFAKDSVNFGILVNYRQTWKPENYQVGDLVRTIPLAPRETWRYTVKEVVKKTRAAKELDDSLRSTRIETSGTSRVEREIIDKAQAKTDFDLTSHGSFGGEGYKADLTAKAGGEQATQSEKAKKHFHEAVLKSAQEYRQQHKMEIDTNISEESERTSVHEIQNPNDELTVTYMFYELQRTFRISEKIHQLTPVILVANEMPAPDAIDDGWLIRHDWILRRVILDDSFKPALEYLTKSFVGDELNLQILNNNAQAQKRIVDKLNQQIEVQNRRIETDERGLADTVKRHADAKEVQGAVNEVARIFDPLGITGKKGEGTIQAGETMVDYLQETFDRAERERARLLDQLGVATTALQTAIDKLSEATKEHYDRIAEVDRLRIHVKDNILYYMQAIWSHEPPDQRFFRIYNIDVPVIEPDTNNVVLPADPLKPNVLDALEGQAPFGVTIPIPPFTITNKKLVEVADIDTILGFKGNYSMNALNQNNYITLHMMQDYLEVADVVKLRDPDEFSSYTVEELQLLAECMFEDDPAGFETVRNQFNDLIIKRLTSGDPEDDRVIVPTNSLYVEALVGTHPLLEDFKLIHRALDVKKVQAEVRHAELENIRLAARALKGKDDDPDIDKNIVIGPANTSVALQPDGN
jgi:hypothetical protein